MPDDSDFAAGLAERERAALIARHRARLPPPTPPALRADSAPSARRAIFTGTNTQPAREAPDRDQERR